VLIDDRLPSAGGGRYYTQLAYCVTRRLQLWASLIEKAFAKACGSYAAIIGGEAGEALSVLTGWPCTLIRFDRENFDAEFLWATLCSSRDAAFLMTCSTGELDQDEEPKLVPFHVYSLTDVYEKNSGSGCVQRLLKIRNPHEKSRWQRASEVPVCVPDFVQHFLADGRSSRAPAAAWSAGAAERGVPPSDGGGMLGEAEDDRGVFHISFQEFLRRFVHCTICRIRSHEWHEVREPVQIPCGSVPSAGLLLEVREATVLTECSISLVQPEERVRQGPLFQGENLGPLACIGFILLRLSAESEEAGTAVASSDMRCHAAVSAEVWLSPGERYLLVPLSLHSGAPLLATCVCVSSRQVAIKEELLDMSTIRAAWAAYARSHDPTGGELFHGAVLHMGKGEGGSIVALLDNLGAGFLRVDLTLQSDCMCYSRGQGATSDWLKPGEAQLLQVGVPGDGSGGAVSWASQHRFHMQGRSPDSTASAAASWHEPPLSRPNDDDDETFHAPFRLPDFRQQPA
jgi:hypothetical protein